MGRTSLDEKPLILIVGTGAMASLFGARLSPYADVTLLGTWKEGVKTINEGGVRLVEADGTEEIFPVRAILEPLDCQGAHYALVMVKSWQTNRAANQLVECLAEDGVVVTLQNGLGNLETLTDVLGAERATLGVTTMGATLLGPGHVRAGGVGLTHIASHPRITPLVDLFQQAGFEVDTAEDLDTLVWGKLVINAAINPLTALLGVPNGELLEYPHALVLMAEVAEETAEVAKARGVELPFTEASAAAVEVAGRTASNRSSMLQDILRGAPTEIDAICGAIALEGESLGVPTPVNRTLWHLVRAMAEARHRDEP
jgi:2-dehydropantoate 2-reductase